MMKFILLFAAIAGQPLYAQEFAGCGEYLFKGVLKADKESSPPIVYIVHDGTRSQMKFEFSEQSDLSKIAVFIETPSTFTGKILKKMDGTKGTVRDVTKIAKRFPNPLSPSDTGIIKIKSIDCE